MDHHPTRSIDQEHALREQLKQRIIEQVNKEKLVSQSSLRKASVLREAQVGWLTIKAAICQAQLESKIIGFRVGFNGAHGETHYMPAGAHLINVGNEGLVTPGGDPQPVSEPSSDETKFLAALDRLNATAEKLCDTLTQVLSHSIKPVGQPEYKLYTFRLTCETGHYADVIINTDGGLDDAMQRARAVVLSDLTWRNGAKDVVAYEGLRGLSFRVTHVA